MSYQQGLRGTPAQQVCNVRAALAAPATVRTTQIWRGAIPYIGLQLLGLLLVASFPMLATWLPAVMLGN